MGRAGARCCSARRAQASGCSTSAAAAGRFVAALRDHGAEPIGVEIAAAALERARANAPGADLRLAEPDGPLPLEDGSVDLVWCTEVLEHVADTAHAAVGGPARAAHGRAPAR